MRNRIYSARPGKLTENELCEIAGKLIKAGYAAQLVSVKTEKGASRTVLEYWLRDEEKPAADAGEVKQHETGI